MCVAVLLALSLLAPPSGAVSHGPPSGTGPSGRGKGRLLPLLPNGELREPSTDRTEFTDSPDITEAGAWDWDLAVADGAVDRIGTLGTRSVDWAHVEVKHGLGHGLELSGQIEPWNQAHVEQGAARTSVDASGYGPTTLRLREHLAGGEGHVAIAVSPWVRLPGSPDGAATRLTEAGVSLPYAVPIGDATRIGGMIETALVADAATDQRHAEGVASLETVRDLGWSGESHRPWLGVLDGGVSWDLESHLGLTLGVSAGLGGGARDVGGFGRLNVHR